MIIIGYNIIMIHLATSRHVIPLRGVRSVEGGGRGARGARAR